MVILAQFEGPSLGQVTKTKVAPDGPHASVFEAGLGSDKEPQEGTSKFGSTVPKPSLSPVIFSA